MHLEIQESIWLFFAYLVKVSGDQIPKGGDDAADAKFYPLSEVLQQKSNFGFEHYDILEEALKKLALGRYCESPQPSTAFLETIKSQ